MDPYHLLGVSRDASTNEIRKAYRALIKKYHPDINAGADAIRMTAMINEAYETLTDREKRSAYDNRIFAVDLNDIQEDPDEVYKREYDAKKAEQGREKARKKTEREAKLYQVGRVLCYPIILFSLAVIVDYYLPVHTEVDTPVFGYQKSYTGRSYPGGRRSFDVHASYVKTTQYEFRVPDHLHVDYNYAADQKKPLYIEFTPIFETFTRVGVDEGEYVVMYDIPGSIYTFIFFPVPYILLALSVAVLRDSEYTRRRYILSFMPAAITICLLILMLW
jgi:hypothetical protein